MIRYVCTMLISLAIAPCLHAMEIFLRLPDNTTITLEVESSDTIENLKQKTTDQTAIPQGQQIMLFEGTRLVDGQTLADYNVQGGETIQLALITPDASGILYVDVDAPAGGAGENWDNALPSLAEALDAARSHNEAAEGTVRQIWVAVGEYQPVVGRWFTMVEAVGIYGGFIGGETALEQRDWRNNETVLRGNGNSVVDNSFPSTARLSRLAVLDGFTITGGQAEIGGTGGGINNRFASPTLNNLVITGNEARITGGGICFSFSSPALCNVLITGNNASGHGGGVSNFETSTPVFTQVTVSGNTAPMNAEWHNSGTTPIIRNSVIWGNGLDGQLYDTRYSLVQGQTEADNVAYYDADNHNLPPDTDPLFAGADIGDFTLQPGSPAVDAGDPQTNEPGYGVQAGDKDLAGSPRNHGGAVDLGAYEVQRLHQPIAPDAGGILYVDADAAADGTGESWSTALPSLTDALDAARSLNGAVEATVRQIWVAAGEYQPASGQSFTMVEAVGIYGGFTGGETALEQRDWRDNETVLRGNGNSVVRNNFQPSYPLPESAVLDGFTITGGDALYGGGVYNRIASPTLSNLIIRGNEAGWYGGGIFFSHSSPVLRNVLITGNNSAIDGGGVGNLDSSAPVFIQVTVSGNSATTDAEFHNSGATPVIRNSIVWGNGLDGQLYDTRYSLVQGQTEADNAAYYDAENHNLPPDTDPLFAGADIGDFTPQRGSPAVDAGDPRTNEPGYAVQASDTDLAGKLRIYRGRVDLGAYEEQYGAQLIHPIDDIVGTYGDPAITPGGTATSGLPVRYASSDNGIAEAFQDAADGDAWKIRVLKAGSVTLTASQPGDGSFYDPADDVTFTLTVNPLPMTVDFAAGATVEKEYDGTAEATVLASGFALTGIVDGDEVTASLSGTQAAYDTKDVGTGKTVMVPLANIGLSGDDAGNYTIDNTADITAAIGTITEKTLTVMARNAAKVYDGEAYSGGNGIDYEGFAAGEDASVLGGTLSYGGTAQGATDAGDYSIAASGLTAANYTVEYLPGTLTISGDAENILSFNVQEVDGAVTRIYGDGDVDGSAVASSGLVVEYGSSNEAVAVVDGNGQLSIRGVGTALITATQRGNANYAAADPVSFSITVGKKGLSVTARNATKVYDGEAYNGGNGVDYQGFVAGEDESVLDGTLTYGGTSQGAEAAGGYDIVPGGLTAANYRITYVPGRLGIVATGDNVLAFDSQTGGSNVPVVYGQVALDGAASATSGLPVTYASSNPSVASVATDGTVTIRGAGRATITASQDGDVNHAAASPISFTVNVARKALVITANNAGNVYDGIPYSGGNGVVYTGFVAGEDESALDGTLTYGGTAQGAVAVGSYAIVPAGLASANYAIAYRSGSLSITKRPVTVMFGRDGTVEKIYDGITAGGIAPESLAFVDGDVLGGDDLRVALTAGIVSYLTAEAGTGKAVAVPLANVSLTGADAGNYSLGNTADIIADIGTITKKPLTVTARNAAKVYDGEVYSGGNGVDYDGFVAGEDASVLGGTLTYGGTAQGAIDAGDYSISVSGFVATNYTLEYHPGMLTISGDAENILSFNIQEVDGEVARTYGEDDVDGSAVASSGLTVEYGSSDEAVVVVNGNGQVSINGVGTALITALQQGNANYTEAKPVSFHVTVGKKGLTVTARNAAKVYDGEAYSGGNGVDYQGFVAGEDASVLGGTLTYGGTAQGAVTVGSYAILPAGLSAANYAINYASGTLTVSLATRSVTFPPIADKIYGTADFEGGATASSGETISYTSSDPAVAEIVNNRIRIAGAGTTTITATVPENDNYSNQPVASQILTVGKAAQTITLVAPEEVVRDVGTVSIVATTTSGLPVSLTIDDPEVATLAGSVLQVHRLGTVEITATQAGDTNYHSADPVTMTLRVFDPTSTFPVRVSKAVSPNGDGINEYLIIEAVKDYPENRVSIFNRNGTVVYEASGYNNGTVAFRGIGTGQNRVQAGTYFYVAEIRVDGEWQYEKGWFVLRY